MKNYEKYGTAFERVDAFWDEHREPNDSHSFGGWIETFAVWLEKDDSEVKE